MTAIKKFNRDRRVLWVLLGVTVLFYLMLNLLTPYIADDYIYMYSFYDRSRIQSLCDVLISMYYHCFKMNGRVVSHTLAQIFLIFPAWVFDCANAVMLTGLFWGMYRLANGGERTNLLLFLGMGAAFWLYLPAFGQVMLWEIGAVNYAWALVFGLMYLTPFVRCFVDGTEPFPKLWQKILGAVGGLLFGMYTEITSFIGIFIAGLLLVGVWLNKRKQKKCGSMHGLLGLWLTSCVGYVILLKMPVELDAKIGGLSLSFLLQNIVTVTQLMESYQLPLLLIWVCVFLFGLALEVEPKRLILSLIFFVGGVAANYMLIVADYIPERCFCTSTMLFILAAGVMIPVLLKTKSVGARVGGLCLSGALAGMCLLSLVSGVYDIAQTYLQFSQREEQIIAARDAGEEEVTVDLVVPATKYSAFWGTKYLDTADNDTWPNRNMAYYYGIRILGR